VAKEIVENAIKSATKDPRFDPLEINELDNITISVDILMESVRVDDIKELDPKEYGIIVRSSYKSGLLLPDLDGVDTVQKQIEIVKSKAGITDDEEFTLERFSVIRHH
jgi:AMMECR1 domain-containing protein